MVLWLREMAVKVDERANEEYNKLFGDSDKAYGLRSAAHGLREAARYVDKYLDECP
jgi:hypothetical protein